MNQTEREALLVRMASDIGEVKQAVALIAGRTESHEERIQGLESRWYKSLAGIIASMATGSAAAAYSVFKSN